MKTVFMVVLYSVNALPNSSIYSITIFIQQSMVPELGDTAQREG